MTEASPRAASRPEARKPLQKKKSRPSTKDLKTKYQEGKDHTLTFGGGLYFRVSRTGVKSWAYRYRDTNARDRWLCIGPYSEAFSLLEARKVATEYSLMRRQGVDPAEQLATLAKRAEAASATEHLGATLADLARLYHDRILARTRKRPEQFLWAMQKHVFPVIGAVKAKELSRGMVAETINAIVDNGTPVMANRVLAMIKLVTRYGTEQGHIDADPASGISRASAGGRERPRDRAMTWDEIRQFLEALSTDSMSSRKLAPQTRIALLWLLMTGQRVTETLLAEWSHIDANAMTWRIPRENTKGDREHLVHLTPQTLALLAELRPLTGSSRYVFASTVDPDQPITRYTVDRALARLQADGTLTFPKIVPHDLRRTVTTRLGDLGVMPHVSEKIANHVMEGVMAIYNRAEYLQERREAIAQWNRHVDGLRQSAI